jgi:agmatine/peptidylarginine deiminase
MVTYYHAKLFLPAEWIEQSAVLIAWPHTATDWRHNLPDIESFYIELSRQISNHEKLLICVQDEEHLNHVKDKLDQAGIDAHNILIYIVPLNDTWTRDFGPITVFENQTPVLLDFEFNAWGNKHIATQDNQANSVLHSSGVFGGKELRKVPLVLEGGAIDSNGQGTLLTTTGALLNQNRNPGLTKQDMLLQLHTVFGLEHIIWLDQGHITGDDTDSHIDTLARFAPDNVITHVISENRHHPDYTALQNMQAQLQKARNQNNEKFELVELPLPEQPLQDENGNILAATYANFLITNETVLVPVYKDQNDDIVCRRLENCFGNRSIVPIDARAPIKQNGSLHCLTMQLPAGVVA